MGSNHVCYQSALDVNLAVEQHVQFLRLYLANVNWNCSVLLAHQPVPLVLHEHRVPLGLCQIVVLEADEPEQLVAIIHTVAVEGDATQRQSLREVDFIVETNIIVLGAFEAVEVNYEDVWRLIDVSFEQPLCILASGAPNLHFDTILAVAFQTIVQVVLESFYFILLFSVGLVFREGFRHCIGEVTSPIHGETNLSEIEAYAHRVFRVQLAPTTVLLVL